MPKTRRRENENRNISESAFERTPYSPVARRPGEAGRVYDVPGRAVYRAFMRRPRPLPSFFFLSSQTLRHPAPYREFYGRA